MSGASPKQQKIAKLKPAIGRVAMTNRVILKRNTIQGSIPAKTGG
jgi:hypothetical protein